MNYISSIPLKKRERNERYIECKQTYINTLLPKKKGVITNSIPCSYLVYIVHISEISERVCTINLATKSAQKSICLGGAVFLFDSLYSK